MEADKILAVIAWPLVGVVALLLFYKPIIDLVSKIKSFKGLGIEVEVPETQKVEAQEAQVSELRISEKEAVLKLLVEVRSSIALTHTDSQLRKELTANGLNVDGDVPKVLIRYLASSILLLHFEQTHTSIFGTQIVLLKRLNEVRNAGRPFEYVQAYFSAIQERITAFQDWDWQQYIDFLKGRELVLESNEHLFITPMGAEYLSWISTMGRSEEREL